MRFFCKFLLIGVTVANSGKAQIIHTIGGVPGSRGHAGNGGPFTTALLDKPFAIATDPLGQLYIGDWHNRVIRKVNATGIVGQFAGNGIGGYSGDGGQALNAQINTPFDISIDRNGNIYFSDLGNEVIRCIDPSGIIRTVAGNGLPGDGMPFTGDGGPALNASLYDAQAIATDEEGNLFIAETAKHTVRMVDRQGIIHTICGQGINGAGYSGDGGPARLATLRAPADIVIDREGNLLIADIDNHAIRKIDRSGIIHTIAGDGIAGYSGDGGLATAARLRRPFGLAVDATGNIYIAEEENHVIRKINPAGIIITVAGTGREGYSGDGGPAIAAKLSYPHRIAIDEQGHIYITDSENHTVRKVAYCQALSTLTIEGPASGLCPGDRISLNARITNGGSSPVFSWVLNGIQTGENGPFFSSSTLKNGDRVNCLVTGINSCQGTISSPADFIVSINEAPGIQLPSSLTVLPGAAVQLKPVVTGSVVSFTWTPAAGLSDPNIVDPFATPAQTTLYQLKARSSTGCETTAEILVKLYRKLYLPTAFSPNGDGRNDIFKIPPGSSFELERFSIFDRWGKIVFSSTDPAKGWDGTYQGVPANPGVFIVLVKGKDLDQQLEISGTVTLIR
ncbi:MAG: gliding motility-associated C-terminal domain-containing protein [Chitinophagaceae bacterium]|nr:gliding motility-associated C-terminal domain-containing protein [Chitinophagaceae bacterium]